MADNQYIYSVARIRSKELGLLNREFIEQLVAARNSEEALMLLRDRGWGVTGNEPLEDLLLAEMEKTWGLMRELVKDMSAFDAMLYENDFINLKAAIKQSYVGREAPGIYNSRGTVDFQTIKEAVGEKDFSKLPEHMSICAKESYDIIMKTGDSQLADTIIDKAALDAIYEAGTQSGIEALMDYAEIKVATSDIAIAVRGHETGREADYFIRAMSYCKSLDIKRLSKAALAGRDEIYSYLEGTSYSDAALALKTSTAAFEVWSEGIVIERMKCQKYNPFTLSPLIAYVLARENEIKSVRIVLNAKLYNLPQESIRERVRSTYV